MSPLYFGIPEHILVMPILKSPLLMRILSYVSSNNDMLDAGKLYRTLSAPAHTPSTYYYLLYT